MSRDMGSEDSTSWGLQGNGAHRSRADLSQSKFITGAAPHPPLGDAREQMRPSSVRVRGGGGWCLGSGRGRGFRPSMDGVRPHPPSPGQAPAAPRPLSQPLTSSGNTCTGTPDDGCQVSGHPMALSA